MFIRSIRSESLSAQTDDQLIEAFCASGDERLASELFSRYLHLVYGVCMKYVEPSEDRSDLVMIIFEKLLSDLPQSGISSFNSWLYALSRNECVSWLRNRDRAPVLMENWELEKKSEALVVENEASKRLNIEEHEIEDRLQVALAQLDERQRLCIHLFFFEKKSYKDIAEHTGFDTAEVKSYLQNGKRRLRVLLTA